MELSISMIEARRRQQAAAGAQSAVAQRRSAQADSSPSQLPSVRPHMPPSLPTVPSTPSHSQTLCPHVTCLQSEGLYIEKVSMRLKAHAVPTEPACTVIASWMCQVVKYKLSSASRHS